MARYIHQRSDWPTFRWDSETLLPLVGSIRHLQGQLMGRLEAVGLNLRDDATLEALTEEITQSADIEGEVLEANQVRSSLARRLGMDRAGLVPSTRDVDGMVDVLLDATQQFQVPITAERLKGWQAALFPNGRSGMYKIAVGEWRDDRTGPMQVVSGPMGREQVHFEAPQVDRIPSEMTNFLEWLDTDQRLDSVLKAGVAHLWLLTIHPFEDGNGRVSRALTEYLLAKADGATQRFYSLSGQIRQDRKGYYDILEKTQKGDLDITEWLLWFLNCLHRALDHSTEIVSKVWQRHQFWQAFQSAPLNSRQRTMLHKLLDDFKGKLSTQKWAKMTKSSHDTALRDIKDLVEKGILEKEAGGGRSTRYALVSIEER